MADELHRDYKTQGDIEVRVEVTAIEPEAAIEDLVDRLDSARGVLLSSSYEYPGRYTRWDMGFVDPPLVLTSRGNIVQVQALNSRGEMLLVPVRATLNELEEVALVEENSTLLTYEVQRVCAETPRASHGGPSLLYMVAICSSVLPRVSGTET